MNMRLTKSITKAGMIFLSALFLSSLSGIAQENVKLKKLLPEGALTEINHAYPNFKVFIVPAGQGNTEVIFEDHVLRVDGIEDMKTRVRMAKYVLQYIENPNKRVEDRKRREDYNALPPRAKMEQLMERIVDRYPGFKYKWVGYDDANMKVKYGERGMYISGVEHPPALEEWAHAIVQLQKEIDETGGELEMHIAELQLELAEARLHLAELRRESNRFERREREPEIDKPPKKQMEQFIQKMKEHYPKFSYKWVNLKKGNVEAAYGDNSLIIRGVEDTGARHEIAQHLINIQKQIDKLNKGEGKEK